MRSGAGTRADLLAETLDDARTPPHARAAADEHGRTDGAGADDGDGVHHPAARPGPEAGGDPPARSYWAMRGFVSSTNLRSAAAAVAAFAVEETSFS